MPEEIGKDLGLTLIDKSDSFYFGFSKLDIMFGRAPADAVKIPYSIINKPGVAFRQEVITAIGPVKKTGDHCEGVYDADILVIALGADYDIAGTTGLANRNSH